jgi:hypothetical protein
MSPCPTDRHRDTETRLRMIGSPPLKPFPSMVERHILEWRLHGRIVVKKSHETISEV